MKSAFWLVWNTRRSVPTHMHGTRDGAVAEAERLARVAPGHEFYVLEAISVSKKVDVVTEELFEGDELDTPPF